MEINLLWFQGLLRERWLPAAVFPPFMLKSISYTKTMNHFGLVCFYFVCLFLLCFGFVVVVFFVSIYGLLTQIKKKFNAMNRPCIELHTTNSVY